MAAPRQVYTGTAGYGGGGAVYGTSAAAVVARQAITQQAQGHPDVVIKSSPDASGAALGSVANGQLVTIIGESGEYTRVIWQGREGYAKTENLRKVADTSGVLQSGAGYGGRARGMTGGVYDPSAGTPMPMEALAAIREQPAIWEWRGQKFTDAASLEAAVQSAMKPTTIGGVGIKQLLAPQHKEKLQAKIKELFAQYAGGDRRLQYHEMQSLAAVLAAELRIPQSSFGNLHLMFYRYDFSGDGELDEAEGVMLIEGMLRAYRDSQETQAGGRLAVATGSSIPTKHLESAYKLGKELGVGGQGAVYLAVDNSNGQSKVVKFYDKNSANMPLDDIIDEFQLLTRLDHPKIARTYEIFQDAKNIYAVSEPYFGGDLTKVVEQAQQNQVAITPTWLTAIWAQICQGLIYLHSKHVMHCDLKEPNVMISGQQNWQAPNVVVIDFGCAKNFSTEARGGGTPGYMPPEVWQHNLWTTKGDTFSLGVMFYRMFTGRIPFGEGAVDLNGWQASAMRCVLPHPPPPQMAQNPLLYSLVCRMLHKEFRSRPTMANILKDPWFRQSSSGDAAQKARATRKLSAVGEKHELHVALLADFASRENLSQLEDVSKLFASLDVDHDGTVTADEARKGLRGKMANEQIEKMIEAMMGDDGQIAYTKFMGHMIGQKQESVTRMLFALFKDIDKDGSGWLDLNEITQMLQRPQVAELMAGKTPQQLMDEIDDNKTGRISWPEFQKYLDKRFQSGDANGWKVGADAEYLSSTHNTWVPCKVTDIHPPSGAIMLACKPGAWIDVPTQAQRVRRPP